MRRQQVAAALRYLQDKADLRGRFERATSLDPQEQDLADLAVETGASLIPGVGPALAARDFERAKRVDDPTGMAMAAASAVPGGKLARLLEGVAPSLLKKNSVQAFGVAPSTIEQRMREQYGEFAQAFNIGLPDTPAYRRIVQEVTAQGPLSDDALREAVRSHPAYAQAGGKAAATELRQSSRGGAAALVDSLSEQGVKARVETSKSPGSRSTYIYASKDGKTVKIRLSDHLPAESGRAYGVNDISTTPQHWKFAAKRALDLLGETK